MVHLSKAPHVRVLSACCRSIVLCVVKDGACFGDLEAMQDLKTYSHTVVTLTYTEVSVISSRHHVMKSLLTNQQLKK